MPEFLFVPGRSTKKTYVNSVRSHVAKSQHAASIKADAVRSQRDGARSHNDSALSQSKSRRKPRRAPPASLPSQDITPPPNGLDSSIGSQSDWLDFSDVADLRLSPGCRTCGSTTSASKAGSSSGGCSSCSQSGNSSDTDSVGSQELVTLSTREPTHPMLADCSLLEMTFVPFLLQFCGSLLCFSAGLPLTQLQTLRT